MVTDSQGMQTRLWSIPMWSDTGCLCQTYVGITVVVGAATISIMIMITIATVFGMQQMMVAHHYGGFDRAKTKCLSCRLLDCLYVSNHHCCSMSLVSFVRSISDCLIKMD